MEERERGGRGGIKPASLSWVQREKVKKKWKFVKFLEVFAVNFEERQWWKKVGPVDDIDRDRKQVACFAWNFQMQNKGNVDDYLSEKKKFNKIFEPMRVSER